MEKKDYKAEFILGYSQTAYHNLTNREGALTYLEIMIDAQSVRFLNQSHLDQLVPEQYTCTMVIFSSHAPPIEFALIFRNSIVLLGHIQITSSYLEQISIQ